MNREILEYIKILTKNDTKTLSQKLGKTVEEVGELARAVLPFDGAAGTVHRFSDRSQILEECADVLLTVLSIAYHIRATDVELDEMLMHKCNKWGSLQAGEERTGNDPIPYEIHITVTSSDKSLDDFKQICATLGVKPIVIDMCTKNDTTIRDIMTSSVHVGNNRTAHDEMERIASTLEYEGWTVVRKKIETVPWHPAAPQTCSHPMPTDCYFESHIAVTVEGEQCEDVWQQIQTLSEQYGAPYISQNAFKQTEKSITRMITLRSYEGGFDKFKETLDEFVSNLRSNISTDTLCDVTVGKISTEFSIYDTNVAHDFQWLER